MRPVLNTIAIVELLAAEGPLGVGDVSRRSGLPKSTAQRCLETLAHAGWIEVAHDAGPGALTSWRLSERFTSLLPTTADLAGIALPHMVALRDGTGESVHLVTLEGTDIVLRGRVPSPGPVQIVLPVGTAVPAYASATGKAILALLPETDLAAHLPARLAALTDLTVANRSELMAELAEIRGRGWAWNRGEWDASVSSVAAPILHGAVPVAAISASTTPARLPPERVAAVAAEVCAAATKIGAALTRLDVTH